MKLVDVAGSINQETIKPAKRAGRPSVAGQIKAAFESLSQEGLIDFSGPKSSNYQAIRTKMGERGSDLDDETIRKHTADLFRCAQ